MHNVGKKKKITLWVAVIVFFILLEAGANLIALNLQKDNNNVQSANSGTNIENILPDDYSQAAVAKRAEAAFKNAGLRLENMKQAYQSWTIPSQSALYENAVNAKSYDVKGDGTTNDTAKIQALLNSVPEKSTVFFPAGRYKISGPVTLAKELTICGEPNTVFECSTSSSSVFQINTQGTPESYLNNVTITGIEFIGPGLESSPVLLYAKYVRNLNVSSSKISDCGYAAILLENSSECVIEKCVFDNIYQTKLGYGVAIVNKCDDIDIRDCFFATKGRYGIATGCKEANPTPDQFPGSLFITNNYFQNMTEGAIDVQTTAGPVIISDNVFDSCNKGVRQLSGSTEITGNVLAGCNMGIVLNGDNVPHVIKNNTVTNNRWEAVYIKCPNVQIINNNIEGQIACISSSNCLIKGNYLKSTSQPIVLSPAERTITMENNFVENSGGLQPI